MNNLPSELFKKIFLYLNQEDLQACYFVCKRWYPVATPLNWESVRLPNDKVVLVKSHLNDSNYYQYFKYGHLIISIKIDCPPSPFYIPLSKPELLLLLNRLLNLSEIDMSYTNHIKMYLRDLLDAEMQHINKIYIGYENYPLDLCFSVCYKFRSSISSMELVCNKSTINFNPQQINILNSLTQFKQLTQPVFYNKHDMNLMPYHVQDVCLRLKHFTFFSDYSISESAMQHLLDTNSQMNINFSTCLSHLDLEFPSLSATYTRILIDCFPNQLLISSIKILSQVFFNWINLGQTSCT
ncbi:hypothetical protein EDC94DRAFT_584669 [Helicostylum pulchrum]|nr:hypothetical protein EDC94DRAFT_584669 [Helicostylum pulchrum]